MAASKEIKRQKEKSQITAQKGESMAEKKLSEELRHLRKIGGGEMTENEAIKRVKEFGLHHAIGDLPYSVLTVKAFEMAIEALKEIQKYRAIGTIKEITDILQIISEGQDDVDESGISTGLLHTLLEYAEYAKIGTVEECQKARERQRTKKYKTINMISHCAECDCRLKAWYAFCPECGQAIGWHE